MLRSPWPWLLVTVSIASGCGGAEQPARNTPQTRAWAAEPPPSVASVKSCLQRHGLTVYGQAGPSTAARLGRVRSWRALRRRRGALLLFIPQTSRTARALAGALRRSRQPV